MTDETATRPALRTQRLLLRPPMASDARRMVALADDFEVAKMTGGMPFPYGPADAETFLARAEAADPASDVVFTVELVGEGLIGGLGFHARGEIGPEVGYWLGRPYWNRGLASEMLLAAMDWARDEWGRRCIVACHFIDNPASGVVLSRAGFLYTGRVEPRACRARGEAVPSRWMVWLA